MHHFNMSETELQELIGRIRQQKCETQVTGLKSAHKDYIPKQNSGGASFYPQGCFPQLCISATCRNTETLPEEERFADSKRIEGTLPEMLEGALSFVRSNMRVAICLNPETGQREDVPQYPMLAVREAALNALLHRDYSRYTESKPICLNIFQDKIVITNPGGLYGHLSIDELDIVQPDTRTPHLISAAEAMNDAMQRYIAPLVQDGTLRMTIPPQTPQPQPEICHRQAYGAERGEPHRKAR